MSNDISLSSQSCTQNPLSICVLSDSHSIQNSITERLPTERYHLSCFDSLENFVDFIEQQKSKIDCLIVLRNEQNISRLTRLYQQGIILPTIIIQEKTPAVDAKVSKRYTHDDDYTYHGGEIYLGINNLAEIDQQINQAIKNFLCLDPDLKPHPTQQQTPKDLAQPSLIQQQKRLAEKLQERLGYLGIYYKRNPRHFYRNLPPKEQKTLLKELKRQYSNIILNYFTENSDINQKIDEFVNTVFFADLSVSHIIEIHMELMGEFAHQLKLEGRNEDILLDYRLALIDIIAHLCEMYRRSIPREGLNTDETTEFN